MYISKKNDYKIISIYPHLNEAPTLETFHSTYIEVFDSEFCARAMHPIRFHGNWYTLGEILELAAACQEAARIATKNGD